MRRHRAPLKIALVLLYASVSLSAQAPDFSGTWALDTEKSRVTASAGITGLIPAGAPKTLHITQPANGTVVIESQVNEAHVRIYKPGAQTTTPAGQGGAVTMTTKWEGRALVSEGAMKAPNGETTTLREVVSLSADGKMLTIESNSVAAAFAAATAGQAEKAASMLVYTKITSVGGCESWPTPCKRPSP